MAAFVGIPLKKSYEVDLVKPLKALIASYYSTSDEPVNFDDAIQALNKLRGSCTSKSLDFKHEGAIELLERYYDQIMSLETKCPPSEMMIPFKWKDAFDKGGSFLLSSSSLTIPSVSYEKVCVLFNIAATQSQVGASQANEGLNNDQALKLSAKHFQVASGIFQGLKHVASSAVGGHELTTDLNPEILNILHLMMLSQAQEAFLYKCYNDSVKEAIVAKVACQCEDFYAEAMKNMQIIKYSWPDKEWLSIMGMKQAAYHGIAEYYQAIVCQQKKEFGEQITRLQKAVECLKGAESRGGAGCPPLFREFLVKAGRAYEEAKKDNDFIYHAKIPDYKALASIGKATLAKPTNIPDRFRPDLPDLFEKLLPVSVQQAVHKLDIRKQEIVNGEIGSLREQTQVLNGALASLNLPAALEDMSGVQLPQSLRDKAVAIRAKGGVQVVDKLISELPDLLKRNKEILEETGRVLNGEEESDNNLREQFKERWTRTPSNKLNIYWKGHIAKYRSIINNAMEADNKVKQKFNSHRAKIELLSSDSEQALLNALPTGSGGGSGLMSAPCVVQLKQLMNQVEAIKNEREVIESELKNATFNEMKSQFLSALARDGAINEEALSVEALGETYGPLQKQVRESRAAQEMLLGNIQRANEEFVRMKSGVSGGNASRETFLKDLAIAHDSYMELLSNLEEGTKFYNDLTTLLVNLQSKVDDFCFARRAERDELCKDLQNAILAHPTQPTPAAPAYHSGAGSAPAKPARPPPPQPQPTQPLPFAQQPYPGYQPYYYPPPPLPQTVNPYGNPYTQNPGYPQQPPPHQVAPGTAPGYPYPQQPPQGYPGAPPPGYPYPQQQPRYN